MEGTYTLRERRGEYLRGRFEMIPSIAKAKVFDLLCRHGFQLEGCNGGGNAVGHAQLGGSRTVAFQE